MVAGRGEGDSDRARDGRVIVKRLNSIQNFGAMDAQ
jgi:hypothetical protein